MAVQMKSDESHKNCLDMLVESYCIGSVPGNEISKKRTKVKDIKEYFEDFVLFGIYFHSYSFLFTLTLTTNKAKGVHTH